MRFRRRTEADPAEADASGGLDAPAEDADPAPSGDEGRPRPVDAGESDHDPDKVVDLGSILLRPVDGMDIRLQVDESTGTVVSALLATEEGAMELRAFASARSGGLWEEIAPAIEAEVKQLGGTIEQAEGPYGSELRSVVPLVGPDGQQVVQPSRIIGIQGPRWLLRVTMLGLPAIKPEEAGPWEDALGHVIVDRGQEAMAPGENLPLRMPPAVRAVSAEGEADVSQDPEE